MTYRGTQHVESARKAGYHPWLLSPAAESFEPVAGVPPQAWLRAYDLDRPTAQPAALPSGVMKLDVRLARMQVLGAAAGPGSRARDRWAFYVRATGKPDAMLRVVFHLHGGDEVLEVPITACLRDAPRLEGAPWFILPALGPRLSEVRSIELEGTTVTLPPSGG